MCIDYYWLTAAFRKLLLSGRTVRLVGGVMCHHSNEVHAQIMCMETSDKKNGEQNSLAQMATLRGKKS